MWAFTRATVIEGVIYKSHRITPTPRWYMRQCFTDNAKKIVLASFSCPEGKGFVVSLIHVMHVYQVLIMLLLLPKTEL